MGEMVDRDGLEYLVVVQFTALLVWWYEAMVFERVMPLLFQT